VPLGFSNASIAEALRNRPEKGMGERFVAFIMPKEIPTMKKVRRPPEE
jgi:hypothetical protein